MDMNHLKWLSNCRMFIEMYSKYSFKFQMCTVYRYEEA